MVYIKVVFFNNNYSFTLSHVSAPAKSRILITIPRFDEGRPVTLGIVDDQGKVAGYPDYSWNDNQGQNCDGLTSVFRVAVSIIQDDDDRSRISPIKM